MSDVDAAAVELVRDRDLRDIPADLIPPAREHVETGMFGRAGGADAL